MHTVALFVDAAIERSCSEGYRYVDVVQSGPYGLFAVVG